MTQYKIQVGSWTNLPDGKVQEDTRAIMEMMGKIRGDIERYHANIGSFWDYIGVWDNHTVLVYSEDFDCSAITNQPSLFIPYEELQKMLNKPETPNVTSLLNTKLDCRKEDGSVDEELSRAFQEACFEQGITGEFLNNKNFLFNTEGDDCVTWCGSEQGFANNANKQINFTYTRKFEWEATIVEPVDPTKVEDEMVSICGVEYSAKELSEALALIKSARK